MGVCGYVRYQYVVVWAYCGWVKYSRMGWLLRIDFLFFFLGNFKNGNEKYSNIDL
jgi:hypothetical protein